MAFSNIELRNFRCFERLTLDLSPQSTLIHGKNGCGKTSILEAIHTLSISKSFRSGYRKNIQKTNVLEARLAENLKKTNVFESRLAKNLQKNNVFEARLAKNLQKTLSKQRFRVETDLRNEKIGFKIREHTLRKVPYLLVVGDKEVEAGTGSIRKRGGEDLGPMKISSLCDYISSDVAQFSRSEISEV